MRTLAQKMEAFKMFEAETDRWSAVFDALPEWDYADKVDLANGEHTTFVEGNSGTYGQAVSLRDGQTMTRDDVPWQMANGLS